MAQRELEILLRLRDEASKELKTFGTQIKSLEPELRTIRNVGVVGFTAVAGAIGLSVAEAQRNESAQTRLSHILKTATGATEDQIRALNKQALALSKVGVISEESVTQAQAQLATFDLQAESIERLTPAILDYVVAEKGASASTEDLKALTNGLAQALQGNFASLTRTGFVLDEATKELIANGTELERTTALVSVLNSTYEGFNETVRDTAEGSMIALRNEFNNLRASVGEIFLPLLKELSNAFIPILENVTEWIRQNPELTKQVILITGAVFGLMAVVGSLSLAFLAFNPIVAGIVIALTGLVVTIRNVGEIFKMLRDDSDLIWEGIKITFKESIDWIIEKTIKPLIDWVQRIIDMLNRVRDGISSIGGKTATAVSSAVSSVKKTIGVQDAIITPQGQVIQTDPADWLIATKRPQDLGQGGGSIVLNITGNTFMSDQDTAEKIGDMIMMSLKENLRLTNG